MIAFLKSIFNRSEIMKAEAEYQKAMADYKICAKNHRRGAKDAHRRQCMALAKLMRLA